MIYLLFVIYSAWEKDTPCVRFVCQQRTNGCRWDCRFGLSASQWWRRVKHRDWGLTNDAFYSNGGQKW